MKLIKIIAACVAAMAAVGATSASAAAANAPAADWFAPLAATPLSPSLPSTSVRPLLAKELAVLTDQGISTPRAIQTLQVEGKVAHANLQHRLRAAMAGAFAGAWFAPAAAQLHVGVTSSASRLAAEGVVAQANLAGEVTITSVRSTMAQLLATQQQWNRVLARLLPRGEAATGLEPQRNAVSVKLSSSMPAAQLAALKRRAAAAGVNVFVTVANGHFGVAPLAKTVCKKWEANVARCNPSITAGVTIQSIICKEVAMEETGAEFYPTEMQCRERSRVGTKGKWRRSISVCSAGPLAINEQKERVLLTAGHCMEETGFAGERWEAFNVAGEASVIGSSLHRVNGGANPNEDKADFGDISIERAWQTPKPNNPVLAVTAEWKKMNEKKEETSYPVRGEREPIINEDDCHVGQTTGESCGEIRMLDAAYISAGRYKEGLIEDSGAALEAEGGDSGGPWLSTENGTEAYMEGILNGTVFECIKVANKVGKAFYKTLAECATSAKEGIEGEWERKTKINIDWTPLIQPVEGAAEGPLKALGLEVLTSANELIRRAPFWQIAGARLEAGKTHNIVVKAAKEEGLKLEGKSVGATVKCTKIEAKSSSLSGSSAGEPGTASTVFAYTGCSVTGNGEGCKVTEPLETKKLKPEQVTDTTAKKLDTLFKAETGSELATVKFTGEKCKIVSTAVKGQVVAEDVTDPSEEIIELGGSTKEAKSWNLRFPTTPVKEITKYKAGVEETAKVEELIAFGAAAIDSGAALVTLSPEELNWIPEP